MTNNLILRIHKLLLKHIDTFDELFKETLMDNVNDNPLFHLGTRQEQIIMAKLRMRSSDLV